MSPLHCPDCVDRPLRLDESCRCECHDPETVVDRMIDADIYFQKHEK